MTTPTTTDHAEAIAARFSEILGAWLTECEQAAVIIRNVAETSPNVCHTHDFCDPNDAMDTAFNDVRDPNGDSGYCATGDPDEEALWAAAWEKASADRFGFTVNIDGRTMCCGAYTSISCDDGVEYCKSCYEPARAAVVFPNGKVSVMP